MKYEVRLSGALVDPDNTSGVSGNEAGGENRLTALLQEIRKAGFTYVEPELLPGDLPAGTAGDAVLFSGMDAAARTAKQIHAAGLSVRTLLLRGEFSRFDLNGIDRFLSMMEPSGIRLLEVAYPENHSEISLQQAALRLCRTATLLAPHGICVSVLNREGDCATDLSGNGTMIGGEGIGECAARKAGDAGEKNGEKNGKKNGVTPYEKLLSLCSGEVYASVDVGAARRDGVDPVALLWRLGSLVKSVHLSGFDESDPKIDLFSCFQFARYEGAFLNVDYVNERQYTSLQADLPANLASRWSTLDSMRFRRDDTTSFLHIFDTETGEIRTIDRFDGVIEAPNWLRDRDTLLYNADGHIYLYDIKTRTSRLVDTGVCGECNNDHVVSPDNKTVYISVNDHLNGGYSSRIYSVPLPETDGVPQQTAHGMSFGVPQAGPAPVTDGKIPDEPGDPAHGSVTPRLITEKSCSYLHGISPDGKELAYCAFREHGGETHVDIYTIPVEEGAPESRRTAEGFNDGPEYAPDGQHIWFISTRSGLMQIYRMNRDGSGVRQMTNTDRNNWFGHISPDNRKVVYISYRKGDLDPDEHLPNMQVELWMMNADGTNPHKLLGFIGGQGSINVNSWRSDSRYFAFVSYDFPREG